VSQDTSGFGFPSGPEYEVLCTNPASLLANERAPLESILRSERLPGFLGVLMVQMYGGPPPSAPTPWLVPQDRYTGRCELRDGANVLMVEPVGLARRLNPAPDDTWGLHLADVNLALGNLVAVVRQQAEAFLPAFVVLRPDLVLKSRCRRGRARVSVVGPERRGVHSVRFRLGKRLVARDRRAPFRKLMRRGARGRLRAVVVMRDGRRAVYSRTLRRCH
jgi:hypothetical protein